MRTVPYDFDLADLIAQARNAGRLAAEPREVQIDGRPALAVTERRDELKRRRVLLLRESDSLVELLVRGEDESIFELFDGFLASIDLDVGVFQEGQRSD